MMLSGRLALAALALGAAACLVITLASRRRAAYGAREEDDVDSTIEDSFPASDPPSHTPVTGEKRSAH